MPNKHIILNQTKTSNLHSARVFVHAADHREQKRFFHVEKSVDLGRNAVRELLAKVGAADDRHLLVGQLVVQQFFALISVVLDALQKGGGILRRFKKLICGFKIEL